jgi:cysteine desulfurase
MIYFDNAAGTPPLSNLPVFFGNPSSPHAIGIEAERKLREAVSFFSGMFHCRDDEIVFTSGGTESNNISLLGLADTLKRKNGIMLCTPAEHPSVLSPIRYIADRYKLNLQVLPFVKWPTVKTEDCMLASFTQVCHETGDYNDIEAIAFEMKKTNPDIIIHVDGAQGFGKVNTALSLVDIYTFSGHKFHGPVGVGGLVVKCRLSPLMYGGGQQRNLRPGTENITGILGMAQAAGFMKNNFDAHYNHATKIKTIISDLTHEIDDCYINALNPSQTSPYILNMSFTGIKAETLVHSLSEQGIYVSMGAACNSRKKISPLVAMGFSKERAESAIRFSFSPFNTMEEAETVKNAVINTVNALRKIKRTQKIKRVRHRK